MELTIRPIRREEFPLLADFLYDAIYRSDPSSPLPRQIIEHPSLRIYIADFGTLPDDRCLVAQAEGPRFRCSAGIRPCVSTAGSDSAP